MNWLIIKSLYLFSGSNFIATIWCVCPNLHEAIDFDFWWSFRDVNDNLDLGGCEGRGGGQQNPSRTRSSWASCWSVGTHCVVILVRHNLRNGAKLEKWQGKTIALQLFCLAWPDPHGFWCKNYFLSLYLRSSQRQTWCLLLIHGHSNHFQCYILLL